jgi:hypothetical protein
MELLRAFWLSLQQPPSTLKMAGFSETLAPVHQTTRHYAHDIRNFYFGSYLLASRPQSFKEENEIRPCKGATLVTLSKALNIGSFVSLYNELQY